MPMKLDGSCQCGAVLFTLQSHTPVPYQSCFCSICRKLGTAGSSINLGGIFSTLTIQQGSASIKKYSAIRDRGLPMQSTCSSERSFCKECSSMLWLWDGSWPELVHPFASAIDTELPVVREREGVCLMLEGKPDWVKLPEGERKEFGGYPEESLEAWHRRTGMWVE